MFASFRYVSRRLLSQGVAVGSVVPAFQAEERNAGHVKLGSPSLKTLIQRREVVMASILAFLCLALFLYRLGDRDLTSSHEASCRAGRPEHAPQWKVGPAASL